MTDLNDFFKLMAEGKKDTPSARAKKIEEQVKESVKTDLGSLFAELSALKNKKEELIQQNPELVVEEVIQEVAPLSTPIGHVPPVQQVEPQSNPALDMVEIGKYLTTTAPKEEGDNPLSEYSIINKKIKFLEQWIGKIQNTGPGSGAAEIYNLDLPTKHVNGDYTIGRKDYYIGVNPSVKTYITLPTIGSNVKDGRVVIIKDESGHAQLTPIKIVGIVDNDPNGAELRINNGALQLIYSNGCWRII